MSSAASTLRALYKAEAAILAAYGWMPYPSDMETEEARSNLYVSLNSVDEGVAAVRKLKGELEKSILTEISR